MFASTLIRVGIQGALFKLVILKARQDEYLPFSSFIPSTFLTANLVSIWQFDNYIQHFDNYFLEITEHFSKLHCCTYN